jgi:hypothetical protein
MWEVSDGVFPCTFWNCHATISGWSVLVTTDFRFEWSEFWIVDGSYKIRMADAFLDSSTVRCCESGVIMIDNFDSVPWPPLQNEIQETFTTDRTCGKKEKTGNQCLCALFGKITCNLSEASMTFFSEFQHDPPDNYIDCILDTWHWQTCVTTIYNTLSISVPRTIVDRTLYLEVAYHVPADPIEHDSWI